jgi:hypothetical protein
MEAKGKVVRLYPAPSKKEADIPSMPVGEPISDLLARRILASQLEQVAGPAGSAWLHVSLGCAIVGLLALVVALTQ